MTDDDHLTPAKPEDIADALAFALCYSGPSACTTPAQMVTGIVAKRLFEQSER